MSEDDELEICDMPSCFRAACIQVGGVKLCKSCAERQYGAKPKATGEKPTITPSDVDILEKDRKAWAAVMSAKVSPEVEAACREELRQGALRGWKWIR